MDRMRESLFSILGDLEGKSFVDLFSGSGSMGLEAESRGAAPVVLVERDKRKRDVILQNVRDLGGSASLVMSPVERYVQRGIRSFDIVFMDPPFAYKHKVDLLNKASRSGIVAPEGLVLLHAPASEELPDRIGELEKTRQKDYGGSRLHIYSLAGEVPAASQSKQPLL